LTYYLTLYFQAVQSYSPLLASVITLPQTLMLIPAAMVVGIVATTTGEYRWALWAGWFLTVISSGTLFLLGLHTTVVEWVFLILLSGLGIGVLFPAHSLAVQASVPQNHIAIAIVMSSFFRSFGQGVGIAVGGVIFQNRFRKELEAFPDLASNATQYLAGCRRVSGDDQESTTKFH
jgi:MFS family permease